MMAIGFLGMAAVKTVESSMALSVKMNPANASVFVPLVVVLLFVETMVVEAVVVNVRRGLNVLMVFVPLLVPQIAMGANVVTTGAANFVVCAS